jgi:hypothetical protein
VEPNLADEKAYRHAGGETACDLVLGVRFQQRVPIECVDIYILWIRRTAKLHALRKLLLSVRTFRCSGGIDNVRKLCVKWVIG